MFRETNQQPAERDRAREVRSGGVMDTTRAALPLLYPPFVDWLPPTSARCRSNTTLPFIEGLGHCKIFLCMACLMELYMGLRLTRRACPIHCTAYMWESPPAWAVRDPAALQWYNKYVQLVPYRSLISHISSIISVFLDGVYVLPQSLLTCHSLLALSLPSVVYLSVCV